MIETETVQEMLQRHKREKHALMAPGEMNFMAVMECAQRHSAELIRKALDLQTSCEDRDEDKWFVARHSPVVGGASLYCRGAKDAAELDQLVQTYAQLGMMIAACIAPFTCGHVGCNVVHVHEAIETAAEKLPAEPSLNEEHSAGKPN